RLSAWAAHQRELRDRLAPRRCRTRGRGSAARRRRGALRRQARGKGSPVVSQGGGGAEWSRAPGHARRPPLDLRSLRRKRLVAARDHSGREGIHAEAIARTYGILEADLGDIVHGVILHDIGKIGIPDSILLKPGPLSPEEWKVMRTHPGVGRGLIQYIPFLAGAVPIVYHHHERWDGNGYPEGLRGEGIPLSCRIFAVADALDAMTFDRPYSRAVSLEAAREEISRCGGTHFDPAVVSTFLSIPLDALQELKRRATS